MYDNGEQRKRTCTCTHRRCSLSRTTLMCRWEIVFVCEKVNVAFPDADRPAKLIILLPLGCRLPHKFENSTATHRIYGRKPLSLLQQNVLQL